GKTMIANHVTRLQPLKHDSAVLVHQLAGLLVQEIRSLVADTSVDTSNRLLCFSPTVATTLATGKGLLPTRQVVKRLTKVAWVANLLTRGQRSERSKPQVHTDYLVRVGQRQGNVYYFNREADVPMLTFPLDRDGFDLALHSTVQSDF